MLLLSILDEGADDEEGGGRVLLLLLLPLFEADATASRRYCSWRARATLSSLSVLLPVIFLVSQSFV